jgi:hypothetical protein
VCFLLAKQGLSLQLTPQSDTILGPNAHQGIRQKIQVLGVAVNEAEKVKMRWKVSYILQGQPFEVAGLIEGLKVA